MLPGVFARSLRSGQVLTPVIVLAVDTAVARVHKQNSRNEQQACRM